MDVKSFITKHKGAAIVAGLLVLTLTGASTWLYDNLVYSHLEYYASEYLERSKDNSTDFFLALSVVKASAAIIEGSSVSLEFIAGINMQVGDLIQPLYDAIDITWKAALLSVTSLQIQGLFLKIFNLSILDGFLITFLILLGGGLLLPVQSKFRKVLSKLSQWVIGLALSIYFIFPIGIILVGSASSYLDDNYAKPARKQLTEKFESINAFADVVEQTNLSSTTEKDDGWLGFGRAKEYLGDKYESIKEKLSVLPSLIKESSATIFSNAIMIVSIYLLEVVIFPVLLILAFWKALKAVLASNWI